MFLYTQNALGYEKALQFVITNLKIP